MGLSVGIGLTNACNLNCAHCYRNSDHIHQLSLDDLKTVCDSIQVSSIGLGTGENALHPQFAEIVEYIQSRGIKLTMASNGYSLITMPDQCLRAFHDVEVSIDFATQAEQDTFRGLGNWWDVHRAIDRCRSQGVEVTILATMMNINYDKMDALARHSHHLGTNLRVNVYQPVLTDQFKLSYEQFWEGYRRLFASARLVSCSEPVVCSVMGEWGTISPCGHCSIRITPEGSVAPCVYWPGNNLKIQDLARLGLAVTLSPEFTLAHTLPSSIGGCPCAGGCASRRMLEGCLDSHDEYCPWVRGEEISLDVELAPAKDLPRSSNVCTTIVV